MVKDAGDDPDVTNKRETCAKVMLSKETGIRFAAGKGVGIVTLPIGFGDRRTGYKSDSPKDDGRRDQKKFWKLIVYRNKE